MSQAPSMPMFWDAYLADTTHLSTEEHGAYLLLLAAMWRRNGWVPDDDKDNARILHMTVAKWRRTKDRLSGFLIFKDGEISQKNLLKNWENVQEKIEKNRENGSKGGRPKTNKNKGLTKADGYVSHNPNNNQPEPEPKPYNTTLPDAGAMCEALGITDETKSVGLLSLSDPINWLSSGCDMQMDILPTLRQIGARGKVVTSWAYCSRAVFEARDRRLSPSPQVTAPISKPAFSKSKSVASLAIENAMRSSNG